MKNRRCVAGSKDWNFVQSTLRARGHTFRPVLKNQNLSESARKPFLIHRDFFCRFNRND